MWGTSHWSLGQPSREITRLKKTDILLGAIKCHSFSAGRETLLNTLFRIMPAIILAGMICAGCVCVSTAIESSNAQVSCHIQKIMFFICPMQHLAYMVSLSPLVWWSLFLGRKRCGIDFPLTCEYSMIYFLHCWMGTLAQIDQLECSTDFTINEIN